MSLRERTCPGLGIIEPCLPSPAKVRPSGPGWLHEIKHDGFRILARRDTAGVRLITREVCIVRPRQRSRISSTTPSRSRRPRRAFASAEGADRPSADQTP
jgi:hypothetical protein